MPVALPWLCSLPLSPFYFASLPWPFSLFPLSLYPALPPLGPSSLRLALPLSLSFCVHTLSRSLSLSLSVSSLLVLPLPLVVLLLSLDLSCP